MRGLAGIEAAARRGGTPGGPSSRSSRRAAAPAHPRAADSGVVRRAPCRSPHAATVPAPPPCRAAPRTRPARRGVRSARPAATRTARWRLIAGSGWRSSGASTAAFGRPRDQPREDAEASYPLAPGGPPASSRPWAPVLGRTPRACRPATMTRHAPQRSAPRHPPRPRRRHGRAAERAAEIGATALQVFTDNPTAWQRRAEPSPTSAGVPGPARGAGIGPLAIHASYLINLAGANAAYYERSVASSRHELRSAAAYGAASSTSTSARTGGARGRDAGSRTGSRRSSSRHAGGDGAGPRGAPPMRRPRLILENSAGGGFGLGVDLEELAAIAAAAAADGVPRDRVGVLPRHGAAWGAGLDDRHAGRRRRVRRGLRRPDRRSAACGSSTSTTRDRSWARGRTATSTSPRAGSAPPGSPDRSATPARSRRIHPRDPGMDEGYDAINLARAVARPGRAARGRCRRRRSTPAARGARRAGRPGRRRPRGAAGANARRPRRRDPRSHRSAGRMTAADGRGMPARPPTRGRGLWASSSSRRDPPRGSASAAPGTPTRVTTCSCSGLVSTAGPAARPADVDRGRSTTAPCTTSCLRPPPPCRTPIRRGGDEAWIATRRDRRGRVPAGWPIDTAARWRPCSRPCRRRGAGVDVHLEPEPRSPLGGRARRPWRGMASTGKTAAGGSSPAGRDRHDAVPRPGRRAPRRRRPARSRTSGAAADRGERAGARRPGRRRCDRLGLLSYVPLLVHEIGTGPETAGGRRVPRRRRGGHERGPRAGCRSSGCRPRVAVHGPRDRGAARRARRSCRRDRGGGSTARAGRTIGRAAGAGRRRTAVLAAWALLRAGARGASTLVIGVLGLPNDHYHAFADPIVVVLVAIGSRSLSAAHRGAIRGRGGRSARWRAGHTSRRVASGSSAPRRARDGGRRSWRWPPGRRPRTEAGRRRRSGRRVIAVTGAGRSVAVEPAGLQDRRSGAHAAGATGWTWLAEAAVDRGGDAAGRPGHPVRRAVRRVIGADCGGAAEDAWLAARAGTRRRPAAGRPVRRPAPGAGSPSTARLTRPRPARSAAAR